MTDFVDEIYKTIEAMIQRYVSKMKISQQENGIVVGESKKGSHRYKVKIKEHIYDVRDGIGIAPAPNTSVWVCIPNGDWSLAYICAGRNAETGFVTDEELRSTRAALEDDIQAVYDACVTGGAVINPPNLAKVIKAGSNVTVTEGETDLTIAVPDIIEDVKVNDVSVVSEGVAEISITDVVANPSGTASDDLLKLKVGNNIYSIPQGGSGNVEDVYVNNSSVLDANHIAQIDLTSYATGTDLQNAVTSLQASFQDGVDDIYDACVAKGSTPTSTSLSDVVQGIMDIPQSVLPADSIVFSSETGINQLNEVTVTSEYVLTNIDFTSEAEGV